MRDLAAAFAQVDAILFVTVAALVAFPALTRKRRPFTRSRAMDVALSALLFAGLGVRYAALCVLVVIYPSAVLPGASPALLSVFAGLFGVAAFVGFVTHRGPVAARVAGAAVLALVSLVELVTNTFILNTPIATRIDSVLAVAIAAAAGICAAFFWTYRTATPNPLGSDKRPFDY